MRLVRSIAAALVAVIVGIATQAGAAKADPVTWYVFAQSPGGLSAIATGIEMLGSCKVPLEFDQSNASGNAVHLTITCGNTGDGAGSIVVKFVKFPGQKNLFATGYEFLG